MKNAIYICLFLSGCATIQTENEFYHRLAIKPTITEQDLGNGQKREIVGNPYSVTIVTTIDCDNESVKRILTIKGNSESSFTTTSDINRNCSFFQWETK